MIENYINKSYLNYNSKIQSNFGKSGIKKFCQQFGADEKTSHEIVETYEAIIADYFKNLSSTQLITLDDLDINLVKTAHSEYIECFSSGADKDKIAYIILGNIASGKSTSVINQVLQGFNGLIVDADYIRQGAFNSQMEYYLGLSPLHKQIIDTEKYHKATNQLSKRILKDVAQSGYNLIIPKSTSSLDDLYKNVQDLINNGYTINLIQCETDFPQCANRNYYRFLCALHQEKNARFVPLPVLKRIDDNTYRVFCSAYQDYLRKHNSTFNEFSIYLNQKNKPLEEIDKSTMVNKFDKEFSL